MISTSSGRRDNKSSAIAPFCGIKAGKSVLPGLIPQNGAMAELLLSRLPEEAEIVGAIPVG